MKQVVKTVDKRVRVTRFPRQQQRQSRSVFILRKRLQESPPQSHQHFPAALPWQISIQSWDMFVEIVAEKKNVHKPVECCPIHQRSNFAPNTSLHVQAMKDSCSRSKQSLFFCSYLTDLYYYQGFNICSSSTRGARDGSSLPPQNSSGSDPSPNVPTENSPPLSRSRLHSSLRSCSNLVIFKYHS